MMMNRMYKAESAYEARAAVGARVILDALFAGEGGSVNRPYISSKS